MPGISARFVPAGPKPEFVADFGIDGHSHIQSGSTCPLPLLWNQMGDVRLGRTIVDGVAVLSDSLPKFLDSIVPFIIRGGKVQKLKTEQIGDALVKDILEAYGSGCKLREAKPYNKCKEFFTPIIIMPMDMDYAHIAGFPPWSVTIYHEGKFDKWISAPVAPYPGAIPAAPTKITVEGVYYYDRKEALASENKGVLVDVSSEKREQKWVYQNYKRQHKATVAAVEKHPWLLIPMFHFDPRRWCNESGTKVELNNWTHGPWDFPFKYVASLKNAGIFIGFKMYPPLGYKPLDPRLPLLDKFYARCEAEGIPVLAHCSPGGMTTHEADLYHALDKADYKKQPERLVSCSYDVCTPLGYFFDEYVHPKNWRPVLMKYPKLKLCLAHFGGAEWKKVGIASDWVEEITNLCDPNIIQGRDKLGREIRFENVYTDMSCYDLGDSDVLNNVKELFREIRFTKRYRHLQDKVLFGVDWYLSLITGAPEYKEYVESFWDTMGGIDEWQWYRSALANPAMFYGLDNHSILKNMNAALSDGLADKPKRVAGYERVKAIKRQVEMIRRELEKVKPKAKA